MASTPMSNERVVSIATSADEIEIARTLFREYADSLDFDLSFQDFAAELAGLPGAYAPPDGALLLAAFNGEYAGCVAVRRLEPHICEMKRLYVRPSYRGTGTGRALAVASIDTARGLGYRLMRLDTVASMETARNLYRSLGFTEIPPYRFNPIAGAEYMELDLQQTSP